MFGFDCYILLLITTFWKKKDCCSTCGCIGM